MDLAILVGLVLGISSIVGGIWLAAAAAGACGSACVFAYAVAFDNAALGPHKRY